MFHPPQNGIGIGFDPGPPGVLFYSLAFRSPAESCFLTLGGFNQKKKRKSWQKVEVLTSLGKMQSRVGVDLELGGVDEWVELWGGRSELARKPGHRG